MDPVNVCLDSHGTEVHLEFDFFELFDYIVINEESDESRTL